MLYVEKLRERVVGETLRRARIVSPFLLRTFEPNIGVAEGQVVTGVRRHGKRIVLELGAQLRLVLHLMIAGRLRWEKADAKPPGKIGLATFSFDHGTLILTEASKEKRAALHVCADDAAVRAIAPVGLDILRCAAEEFGAALRRENHTLKRALTDPRLFDGVGNAYSDEILHAAKLSPMQLTRKLSDADAGRLHVATVQVLTHWIAELHRLFADRFPGPGDITAFRPEFAVHGKFEKPCPVCGAPVQRIVYANNETNYCPGCQTGGRILADRSLSRLLKDDWPRTLEELEGG